MTPSNNFPFLIAQSLTCARGGRLLFKSLSFSISSGEALQITGQNGIGKSSLLRILAGLLRPESGEVHRTTDLFYLGHQLGLKKTFTVEENLCFDMRYPKLNDEKINFLLREVALTDCVGKQTGELSQGQQQRLALAKCLLTGAKLWLLDEPFVALDIDSLKLWQNKIAEHVQQGGAVVISSHFPITIPDISLEKMELLSC